MKKTWLLSTTLFWGLTLFIIQITYSRETQKSVRNTAPSWSPDSKKITFYSNRDGNYEIYIMNSDGTDQRRLTNNSKRDYLPKWSPDGSKILYFSGEKDDFQIYMMNVDGSNKIKLTHEKGNHEDPNIIPQQTKK